MANYEIKIRISSEEVFQMLARYAPWELVDVEELPPNPLPKAPPAVKALASHLKRLNAVKFDSVAKSRKMQPTRGFDLTKGMNAVVIGVLADGKTHTTAELIEALAKNNYARASINSLVMRLEKFGFIQRVKTGHWKRIEHALSNPQEAS